MPAEWVLDGVRWAVIAVFTLSAAEKGTSLWTRSAAWHPVMVTSPGRRRRATPLMASALMVDGAVIALLILRPSLGGVAAALVAVAYTWLGWRVQSSRGHSCRCLWKVLDSTTRLGFVGRNAVIVALGLVVALQAPSDVGVAALAFGAAVLVGLRGLIAGLDMHVRWVSHRSSVSETANAEGVPRLGISPATYNPGPQRGDAR